MATCTPHNVETNLSCRTCGTPVCTDCAVRTAMDQALIWGGHGPHGEGASAEANHGDGAILALRS